MEDFTMAELGVFLGVLGGILTSLLLTVQKSKCSKISCCGAECIRQPKAKPPDPKAKPPDPPPDPPVDP
jgi:hypothetical protein